MWLLLCLMHANLEFLKKVEKLKCVEREELGL